MPYAFHGRHFVAGCLGDVCCAAKRALSGQVVTEICSSRNLVHFDTPGGHFAVSGFSPSPFSRAVSEVFLEEQDLLGVKVTDVTQDESRHGADGGLTLWSGTRVAGTIRIRSLTGGLPDLWMSSPYAC